MIVDVIRAILKTVTNGVYRTFTADGRSDETLGGKMMQHYGFSSKPLAGTEILTVQYGNNNFSIAENDGDIKPDLDPGDVALYIQGSTTDYFGILLQQSSNNITVLTADGNIQIIASGNSTININATNVYVGADPGDEANTYKLATENFIKEHYLNHIHASNGVPLTEGVTPGVMKPDVLPSTTDITRAA